MCFLQEYDLIYCFLKSLYSGHLWIKLNSSSVTSLHTEQYLVASPFLFYRPVSIRIYSIRCNLCCTLSDCNDVTLSRQKPFLFSALTSVSTWDGHMCINALHIFTIKQLYMLNSITLCGNLFTLHLHLNTSKLDSMVCVYMRYVLEYVMSLALPLFSYYNW
jgi:hypothetical protein